MKKQNPTTGTELTPLQERFVRAYFEHRYDSTAAAEAAGYSGSREVLQVRGYKNLRLPHVQAATGHQRCRQQLGLPSGPRCGGGSPGSGIVSRLPYTAGLGGKQLLRAESVFAGGLNDGVVAPPE